MSKSKRQIVLDVETTGLLLENNNRIVEIGCVELIDRVPTGSVFHFYVNPERGMEEEAQQISGISEEFLVDKLKFKDIADSFLEYIRGADLIIHNAPFDVSFLEHEFSLLGRDVVISNFSFVIDTLVMARRLHPGLRNSLDALCKRYGVDYSVREFHGALLDAKLLSEVYLKMTGGQASLFKDEEEKSSDTVDHETSKVQISKTEKELIVIYANQEELAKHSDRLEAIQEKSGQCLWLKDKGDPQ
jgi:DNA polymerase III subunit epsilon